jgi:hypothetical protein
MKKTLITAAALGLLAIGLSAQAGVVSSGTAYYTQGTGNNPVVQVVYSVNYTATPGALYTYSYTFEVGNLVGSIFTYTPSTGNPVTSFSVQTPFSLSIANMTSLNGGTATLYANSNITWNYSTAVSEDTVSYTSDYPPTLGLGSANDGGISWAAGNPGGSDVPNPAPVPEASTVMAGALMLLPLGIGAVRALRKERIA